MKQQTSSDRRIESTHQYARVFVTLWSWIAGISGLAQVVLLAISAANAPASTAAFWGVLALSSLFEASACLAFLKGWRGGRTLLKATCILNVVKLVGAPLAMLGSMFYIGNGIAIPEAVIFAPIFLAFLGFAWIWVRLYRYLKRDPSPRH